MKQLFLIKVDPVGRGDAEQGLVHQHLLGKAVRVGVPVHAAPGQRVKSEQAAPGAPLTKSSCTPS